MRIQLIPVEYSESAKLFQIVGRLILFSTGYIFPLRAVKDQKTRTLGPHGGSTEVSFPRRGSMGKTRLSNKIPKRTTVIIKHQPDSQEIEDSGSGARRRRADTTSH